MISSIQSVDTRVLESLYAMRDPSIVQALIGVSELGTMLSIYGIGAAAVLLLVLYRHYAYAVGLILSIGTCGVVVVLSKGLVERARPPISFRAYPEIWYSFPSAHAALSAALYFFLAFAIWKLIPSPLVRWVALITSFILVVAISFSRIYLGVHYLSDIIGGLMLGIFCAWLGYRWVCFARSS